MARMNTMQPDRERSNAFVEADEQYMEILGKSFGGGPFFSMYAETMQKVSRLRTRRGYSVLGVFPRWAPLLSMYTEPTQESGMKRVN